MAPAPNARLLHGKYIYEDQTKGWLTIQIIVTIVVSLLLACMPTRRGNIAVAASAGDGVGRSGDINGGIRAVVGSISSAGCC